MISKEITDRLSNEALEHLSLVPTQETNKSKALYRIAYSGLESGLLNNEVALLIELKGLEWGVFKSNEVYTKCKRILEIVRQARTKYNETNDKGRYERDSI